MKQGATGRDVRYLQLFLGVTADGIWGPKTTEAVKAWQLANGLVADGIIGRLSWSKIFNTEIVKSGRNIKEIIIHCSATVEGRDVSVKEITDWHKQRGFNTIGYHYVVYLDGSVHPGRSVHLAGAHCLNHNAKSIGICYVGGLDFSLSAKDTRTPAQIKSLGLLIACMRDIYGSVSVLGHRDTSEDKNHNGKIDKWEWVKECPSFDVKEAYPQ